MWRPQRMEVRIWVPFVWCIALAASSSSVACRRMNHGLRPSLQCLRRWGSRGSPHCLGAPFWRVWLQLGGFQVSCWLLSFRFSWNGGSCYGLGLQAPHGKKRHVAAVTGCSFATTRCGFWLWTVGGLMRQESAGYHGNPMELVRGSP